MIHKNTESYFSKVPANIKNYRILKINARRMYNRAIGLAVSRRLPAAAARVQTSGLVM
jgi:hypothetical protein